MSAVQKGKVWLVGAGPGDPDLLTVKAQNALRAAEVVLHDDLVSPEVLALVPEAAEVHYVGKRSAGLQEGQGKHVRQEEINFLMVEHAAAGRNVVRLKSGDPLIFGRLAEEIDALRAGGIEFEIVPGVTAAFGAAAVTQMPLTHRNASSAVVFVTAHTAQGRTGADWSRFAGPDTTLVIYMPGRDRESVARRLVAAGTPARTPVAVISRASTPQQQVYATTLAHLHRTPDVPAPTLLIVGEVVNHADVEMYLPDLAAEEGWWDSAAGAMDDALPSDIFFSTVLMGYQDFDRNRVELYRDGGPTDSAAHQPSASSVVTPSPRRLVGREQFVVPPDSETWSAEKVLEWAFAQFGDRVAISTAFGAEGMVTVDMASKLRADFRLFTIDTEFLFPETYDLMDRIESRYGVTIEKVLPLQTPEEQERELGAALWMRDADRCCDMRKVEPLRRKLAELSAWITSVRRNQTSVRASAQKIAWDAKYGLVKVNPLADWTKDQVWDYIRQHDVPYNVLHDANYPSIGCTNCTRAVRPGEDERAGRWPHLDKTECGLHVIVPAGQGGGRPLR